MKPVNPAIPERLKRLGVKNADWFIACKDGLRWLMRPGIPLKIRVSICLILHSQGYNNELSMRQVKAETKGDAPLFVALSPSAIIRILQKFAIEECRRSAVELDERQRKSILVSAPHMRRCLDELEQEDGTITRVRAPEPKKLIGLTFDEAMEKGLITPIANLTKLERKKLNQRSFIYVHTHPRKATKEALMRRVDQERLHGHSKTDDDPAAVSADQLCLDLGNEFGVSPELLKQHPAFSREVDKYLAIAQRVQRDEDARKRQELKMRGMAELIAREAGSTFSGTQRPLDFKAPPKPEPPSSAPLNPPVEELPETSSAVDTTDRRAPIGRGADPSLVSQPRGTQPTYSHEAHQLLDVLLPFGIAADLEGCAAIIARCRESQPKCTIAGICAEAQALVPIARKKDDAFAWLIWKLPKQVADDPDREVERMAPGYSGLRPAAEPEAAVLDTTPEPEEAAQLKEQISKLRLAIKNAGKDLRDAGTSSIAIGRAKAKLGRLKADEEDLQTKLGKLLNPVANRPVQSEQAGLRPAEAAHGD